MKTRQEIGAELRRLRGSRSLKSVADAIGMSESSLNMYELGQRIPKDPVKSRIAKFYGVSVGSLFFGEDVTISDNPS